MRTRFVVDILSGISAGGINGVFLAKAIAEQMHFAVSSGLWLETADIESSCAATSPGRGCRRTRFASRSRC